MDKNYFESPENQPLLKENVVAYITEKGSSDPESLHMLEKFIKQKEAQLQQEGRTDAHLESLREKAHVLNLAHCLTEAVEVMQTVATIAQDEGDAESHEEALWIIGKLNAKINASRKTTKKAIPSQEFNENVSREKVLNAFKALTHKGSDPADLDPEDEDVARANQLLEAWYTQRARETDDDIAQRRNFERTMFFVDAGFHDPEYLKDVLDWILQDAGDVAKIVDDPRHTQLRNDMAHAIQKIRKLLNEQ